MRYVLSCCKPRWQMNPSGGAIYHTLECTKSPGRTLTKREMAQVTNHPSRKPWEDEPYDDQHLDRDDWTPERGEPDARLQPR